MPLTCTCIPIGCVPKVSLKIVSQYMLQITLNDTDFSFANKFTCDIMEGSLKKSWFNLSHDGVPSQPPLRGLEVLLS